MYREQYGEYTHWCLEVKGQTLSEPLSTPRSIDGYWQTFRETWRKVGEVGWGGVGWGGGGVICNRPWDWWHYSWYLHIVESRICSSLWSGLLSLRAGHLFWILNFILAWEWTCRKYEAKGRPGNLKISG